MAELQLNKRYVNEAELGGDLFRQTSFYSDKALQTAFDSGMSFDLGKIAFENRNRDLSSIGISMNDYNYLSGLGQMTALETAFVLDPNATDKTESGKEYNIRDANIEILKAEINKAKNQEINENTGWFVKALGTVGSSIANIGVEFYGAIEGILDAGATILYTLNNNQTILDWIEKDKTGYKAAKQALTDFNERSTFIGQGGVVGNFSKFLYDSSGLAGNLAWILIPTGGAGVAASRLGLTLGSKAALKATGKVGVNIAKAAINIGRGVYWGSMAGHTAQQAVDYSLKNDVEPISGATLGLYTASVMGVELITELAGGKIFGGSAMDRLVLGKLAQPSLRMGTKLSTKSALGAIMYRSFGDVLGEGVEEMAAEWAEGLLYSGLITHNPDDQASFGDIMYAGLLGGVMGGLIGSVRTATTKPVSVTRDGRVILTSELTDEQKKTAVQLTKTQTVLLSDNLFALNKQLNKELDFTAQARETNKISQENAKELAEKQNKKLIQSAAGLSNFFANLGDEQFKASFNLLTGSIEQQAQSIRNFANRAKPETKIYKELVEEYNKAHPTQSLDIVDTPSIEAQRIQKYVQDKFGVNVLIMKTGAQDGISEAVDGVTFNEYTIGFREDALKSRGAAGVLNDVIAHELAHTLAFGANGLTAKQLLQVKRVCDDLGIKTTKTGKALKLDVIELSEAQSDAIAETLLFDDTVIQQILFGEHNIFVKAYNWMKDLANKVHNDKSKNRNKNYETYKTLVKRMAAYRKAVAHNVGNKEDADKFIAEMGLTDIEIKELFDTYLPTWRTDLCSITKYNLNNETLNKMTAVNILANARKDKNDNIFDFSQAFNPEYYDAAFIADLTEQMPNTPFKEALQTSIFVQTGYIISNDGWVIDGSNVISALNDAFVDDLTSGEMLTREKIAKYPTLHQLLKPEIQKLFVGADGSSATEIRVIFKNSGNETSFDADYNYVTKELSLTLPAGNIKTKIKRAGFEEQLKRCLAMAIADVHSFYGGLVPIVVQQSLTKMNDKQFEKLSTTVLTDEYLSTQPSKQEQIDSMTHKIVELTTTQRTLDDVTSGFITDGINIQGYGDFFGINFAVAGAPSNNALTKTLRDINEQHLTVAYKTGKKSPADVEGQLTFDLGDEKEQQNKTPEKKDIVKKQPEKPKKPNDRVKKTLDKFINFKFDEQYVSQTQKMDKLETEDKTFDKAVRREFLEKFDKDLIKMTDEDVAYYLDYYKKHIYDLSISARKAFMLMFEYVWSNKAGFSRKTQIEMQKFLTETQNLSGSSLSTFGHLLVEAHPLAMIERQMLQETGVEFTIPQHMKDRWVDAARSGDIETQTAVELRVKELARAVIRKTPSRFNMFEKGISKEERRKRWNNLWDRINAYRYLAMLSNPATHIRNIVGNYGIKALSRAAEGFEKYFNQFIKFDENDLKYLPEQKVTKEDLDYVENRFKVILDSVSKVGKYDTRVKTDAAHIMDNLRTEEIFGGDKVFRWLQTLIYDKSLSKMDAKISRPELRRTLTQLLVANFPKEFAYDKAHYNDTLGDLFNKLRPIEDLIETYDTAHDAKEAELIGERDAANQINDTKTYSKASYELGELSDVYAYVAKQIDDYIDVNDIEGLKGLLECETKTQAENYMKKYHEQHKNPEKISDVKKQIKKARDILETNGLSDEKLTTLFSVATRKTLTNYLRYENRLFKAWCKLMDDSVVMKILGSVFMPFAKVVTNMTLLTLQYSPLTLIRGIKNMVLYSNGKRALPEIKMDYKTSLQNLTNWIWYGVDDARFLKAQAAEDLGKGTVGTLLLLLGLILAQLGVIDRDEEDEKYGGYVLHAQFLGNVFGEDIKIKLSDLAPSMTPLLAGVALTVGARDKGISGALERYWEQVTNDTLYGSFNNLFESYGGNILEKGAYAMQTYVSQYVPAYLRGWQKVTDSKAAVNYQDGWFKTTLERAISAVPFVSGWLLPSKIDPYTGEVDRAYNSLFAAILNRWLPVSVSVGKQDKVRLEAQALGATTTTSTGKVVINDTNYNLKGYEKEQFQSNRAQYANSLISSFMNDKTKLRVQQEDGTYKELTYSQMTNEEKQTAFKSYYSKATNYAKIKYWVTSGHKYVTSSRDEYETLRKLGINATYRVNTKGSKFKE